MARQRSGGGDRGGRRGGGRGPRRGLGATPDIRGTLGTLLRTTWEQMGALREAFERQARNQRVRIDGAMLERKRRDMLAALGEAIYELARAGEVGDVEEVPEIADLIADIEYIDDRIDDDADRSRQRSDPEVVSATEWASGGGGRRRFHHPPAEADPNMRVWRPVKPSRDEPRDDQPGGDDNDDAVPKATTRGRSSRRQRSRRAAGGGIAFRADPADSLDDDDDLAEYMHPDDLADGDEK